MESTPEQGEKGQKKLTEKALLLLKTYYMKEPIDC